MGILKNFKNRKKGSSEFSRFFREASSGDRKKVLKEAARRASEDQRSIFPKSKLKKSTN